MTLAVDLDNSCRILVHDCSGEQETPSTETTASISSDYSRDANECTERDENNLHVHNHHAVPPVIKLTHKSKSKSSKRRAMRHHSKRIINTTSTTMNNDNESFSSSVSPMPIDKRLLDLKDASETTNSDPYFPDGNFLDRIQPTESVDDDDGSHLTHGEDEGSEYTHEELDDDDDGCPEGESFLAAVANVFVQLGEGDYKVTTDDVLEMRSLWTGSLRLDCNPEEDEQMRFLLQRFLLYKKQEQTPS